MAGHGARPNPTSSNNAIKGARPPALTVLTMNPGRCSRCTRSCSLSLRARKPTSGPSPISRARNLTLAIWVPALARLWRSCLRNMGVEAGDFFAGFGTQGLTSSAALCDGRIDGSSTAWAILRLTSRSDHALRGQAGFAHRSGDRETWSRTSPTTPMQPFPVGCIRSNPARHQLNLTEFSPPWCPRARSRPILYAVVKSVPGQSRRAHEAASCVSHLLRRSA